MAQVALTSLCESHLADTATMLIVLFPIRNQDDPMWKQHLEAVSNPEGPHFHVSMAALAEYAQHLPAGQHRQDRHPVAFALGLA
jgi:hypothetical protein